jgi:hypothetical protein
VEECETLESTRGGWLQAPDTLPLVIEYLKHWVHIRAIVDAIKKKKDILSFQGIQLQFLGHPAHKFVNVSFLSQNKTKSIYH